MKKSTVRADHFKLCRTWFPNVMQNITLMVQNDALFGLSIFALRVQFTEKFVNFNLAQPMTFLLLLFHGSRAKFEFNGKRWCTYPPLRKVCRICFTKMQNFFRLAQILRIIQLFSWIITILLYLNALNPKVAPCEVLSLIFTSILSFYTQKNVWNIRNTQ